MNAHALDPAWEPKPTQVTYLGGNRNSVLNDTPPDQAIGVSPSVASNVRTPLAADAAIRAHLDWARRAGKRPATIQHRHYILRMIAAWHTATYSLDLLHATPQTLDAWQAWLVNAPSARTGEPCSLDSMSTYSTHVRMFFKWARRAGLIIIDPADELPVPRLVDPVDQANKRTIGEDDLRLAIRCATEPLKTWLILAAYLGLRRGEIARIERQDIHDREREPVLYVRGKGGRNANVPLTAQTLLVLGPYLTRHHGRIFRNRDGKAYEPEQVGQIASDYFHDHLGMPYTLHWCRHRLGTAAYRQSHDIRAVQKLLRHAKVSTTQIYAHEADGAVRSIAEEIGVTLIEALPERHLTIVKDEPSHEHA